MQPLAPMVEDVALPGPLADTTPSCIMRGRPSLLHHIPPFRSEILKMRVIYLVILLVMVLAIAAFALQNDSPVTVRFMDRAVAYPLSLVVGAVYLIGMISGSSLIGLFRRSVYRATEPRDD
jgi:putative membrane protein